MRRLLLLVLFAGLFFDASTYANETSVSRTSWSEGLSMGLGATGYLGSATEQEWLGGLGLNLGAYYSAEPQSHFLIGLDLGIAEGRRGILNGSNKSFNLGYLHPSLIIKSTSGWAHPKVGLGLGPAFFDAIPVFSASFRAGLDFEVFRSFSILLEPIRLNWFYPNLIAWAPQLGFSLNF